MRKSRLAFKKISNLAKRDIPFLFIISFNKEDIYIYPLANLTSNISYIFNQQKHPLLNRSFFIKKEFIPFSEYKKRFQKVIEEIKRGNTYLLNLTFPTKIEFNLNLDEIFAYARAPYKLLIENEFVCFSPEKFVEIIGNKIYTYPMKGTIDASIKNAKKIILNDKKEMAEHIMITDLMRNDLNMIGENTKVEKFRYIDKIRAGKKELLQVSSKISSTLPNNWREHLGDILDKITPAGSISGTPKQKTLEIISNVEIEKRGLYTGIFGIYKENSLSSAVMIRSITKKGNFYYYHSGGGITIDSIASKEYQELQDKVYIPI